MISKIGAAVSLAALASGVAASVSSRSDVHPLDMPDRTVRSLVPAHIPGALVAARDTANPFQPKQNFTLHYVDEATLPADVTTWGASVGLALLQPAVLTEQLRPSVSSVTCSPAGVTVKFASAEVAQQAQKAWTTPDFMIITLDAGCNPDNTRTPYNVTKVDFDTAENSAVLAANLVQWADVAADMDLEFGDREHEMTAVNPTKSVTKRDVDKDFDLHLQNQVIYVEKTPEYMINQKCVDCEVKGHFSLAKGNVKTKASGIVSGAAPVVSNVVSAAAPVISQAVSTVTSLGDKIGDGLKSIFKRDIGGTLANVFEDISVDITATGIGATFSFETDVLGTKTWTYHLLKNPISLIGFEVPGILSVGPMIDPTVVMNIKMPEPFKFDYGFKLTTPDNSKISLNLLQPTGSSVSGFQDTKFDLLPFSTNIKNITQGIDFSIAFRPLFEIGMELLKIKIDPVVVFTDLPRYAGEIQLKHNVDKDCKPAASNGGLGFAYNSSFALDFGVGMDIKAAPAIGITPSYTLLHTTLAPMSTCFVIGGGDAVPAKTTAANVSKKTTAASSKATSSPSAARKDAGYTTVDAAKSHITTPPVAHQYTTPKAATPTSYAGAEEEECDEDEEEEPKEPKKPILPKRALAPSVVTDVIAETTTVCPLTLTHTSGSSTYTVITSTVSTIKPTVSVFTDVITATTTICPLTLTHTSGSTTYTVVTSTVSTITPSSSNGGHTPSPTPSVSVETDHITKYTTFCPITLSTTTTPKISVTTDVIVHTTTYCPLSATSSAGAKVPTGSNYVVPNSPSSSPIVGHTGGASRIGMSGMGVMAVVMAALLV